LAYASQNSTGKSIGEAGVIADLQALIDLQQIDLNIIESDRRIQSIPLQLQEIDSAIQKAAEQLNSFKDQLSEKQKLRRQDELEAESLRAKLSKYKEQLMAVKNNREYSAMLKEIELCEAEIRKTEDRILESMEAIEGCLKGIKDSESIFQQDEGKLLSQRRELEAIATNHQEAHDELLAVRAGAEKRVNKEWLGQYRRIAERRNGIGLAEAQGGCCMVCRVRLRPQVYTDIRKGDVLRQCDSCGRILYRLPSPKPATPEPMNQEIAPAEDNLPTTGTIG
jgi:uncharacterized protein